MPRDREKDSAAEALHEHRVLESLIPAITLNLSPEARRTRDEDEALVRLLKDFRGHLRRHFEHEEGAGLFEDILERLPAADADVRKLKREHVAFLNVLDLNLDLLESPGRTRFESISRHLKNCFDAFQAHEEKENDLFQRAYYLDVGDGD